VSKPVDIIKSETGLDKQWSGWMLVRTLLFLLPTHAFMRTRATILKMWGLPLGRGVMFSGTPVFAGSRDPRKTLKVGQRSFINYPVHFDCSAAITIGVGVSVGHHCIFVTTGHEIGTKDFRAADRQLKPIVVGDGVWIGACVTILPGVTIGEGAVIAAGAVVNKDIAANTLVGGVPAKLIRPL
jgi:acetyltransferase-like isoleucine patch superfamily enzyme